MTHSFYDSESMKKLIYPLISSIPRLIEYTYSPDEESDIDKFQMRKCINFKKMILEALKPGDGVGVPVPVAYDDIRVNFTMNFRFLFFISPLRTSRKWKAGLCFKRLL